MISRLRRNGIKTKLLKRKGLMWWFACRSASPFPPESCVVIHTVRSSLSFVIRRLCCTQHKHCAALTVYCTALLQSTCNYSTVHVQPQVRQQLHYCFDLLYTLRPVYRPCTLPHYTLSVPSSDTVCMWDEKDWELAENGRKWLKKHYESIPRLELH